MDSLEQSDDAAKRTRAAEGGRRPHGRRRVQIGEFMTDAPHSIGADQTLETAHGMMREHRIRHLPVLRAGKLVGLVSQRDLYLVETLHDVDPHEVKVAEAMTQKAYCVTPKTPLARVCREMAEKKYGCAVVMDEDDVVGIFTSIDALRALVAVLEPSKGPTP